MTGSAVGRGGDAGSASPRLDVPEPVLDGQEQGLESEDNSMDSNDGEYEGNDQSEESEESGERNELDQDEDDADQQLVWGAQRPIRSGFRSSQYSILTITPGNTQSSNRRISYPGQRTSAPVRVSPNGFASAILPRAPTVLDPLATLVITPSHPEPTTLEPNSEGIQQTSSRRNLTVGLERSILAKARDLIWDWTIFVNPFPDPIILTEEVRRCWSDAQIELSFLDFVDATPHCNEQVSYP